MAAIIAHITRANRERIEKKRYEIVISKCMYEIKPFDKCFNPKVSFTILYLQFRKTQQSSNFFTIVQSHFFKWYFFQHHNKYVAAKAMNIEIEDSQAFHQLFIDRLKELHREESRVVEFSWMYVKKSAFLTLSSAIFFTFFSAFLKELMFMLMSISFVPVLMLMVCISWPLQVNI